MSRKSSTSHEQPGILGNSNGKCKLALLYLQSNSFHKMHTSSINHPPPKVISSSMISFFTINAAKSCQAMSLIKYIDEVAI